MAQLSLDLTRTFYCTYVSQGACSAVAGDESGRATVCTSTGSMVQFTMVPAGITLVGAPSGPVDPSSLRRPLQRRASERPRLSRFIDQYDPLRPSAAGDRPLYQSRHAHPRSGHIGQRRNRRNPPRSLPISSLHGSRISIHLGTVSGNRASAPWQQRSPDAPATLRDANPPALWLAVSLSEATPRLVPPAGDRVLVIHSPAQADARWVPGRTVRSSG